MDETPRAPRGLKATGKAYWRSIVSEFDLHSGELLELMVLCQTLDDRQDARAALAASGQLVEGAAQQPRANPLIPQIVAYGKLIDQLVVALGLPIPGDVKGRRRSPLARLAAAGSRQSGAKRGGRLSSVEHVQRQDGGA
jgi:hypothetical protein